MNTRCAEVRGVEPQKRSAHCGRFHSARQPCWLFLYRRPGRRRHPSREQASRRTTRVTREEFPIGRRPTFSRRSRPSLVSVASSLARGRRLPRPLPHDPMDAIRTPTEQRGRAPTHPTKDDAQATARRTARDTHPAGGAQPPPPRGSQALRPHSALRPRAARPRTPAAAGAPPPLARRGTRSARSPTWGARPARRETRHASDSEAGRAGPAFPARSARSTFKGKDGGTSQQRVMPERGNGSTRKIESRTRIGT